MNASAQCLLAVLSDRSSAEKVDEACGGRIDRHAEQMIGGVPTLRPGWDSGGRREAPITLRGRRDSARGVATSRRRAR